MKKVKIEEIKNGSITRKEAIKKSGYVALSAASMMLLLSNPKKAAAQETSPSNPQVFGTRNNR